VQAISHKPDCFGEMMRGWTVATSQPPVVCPVPSLYYAMRSKDLLYVFFMTSSQLSWDGGKFFHLYITYLKVCVPVIWQKRLVKYILSLARLRIKFICCILSDTFLLVFIKLGLLPGLRGFSLELTKYSTKVFPLELVLAHLHKLWCA
jgi:hypothetical protein